MCSVPLFFYASAGGLQHHPDWCWMDIILGEFGGDNSWRVAILFCKKENMHFII